MKSQIKNLKFFAGTVFMYFSLEKRPKGKPCLVLEKVRAKDRLSPRNSTENWYQSKSMKTVQKIKISKILVFVLGTSWYLSAVFLRQNPVKNGSETLFSLLPCDFSSTEFRIAWTFRNSTNFGGMYLRAQGELEAGIGTVEKPSTRTLTEIWNFWSIFSGQNVTPPQT